MWSGKDGSLEFIRIGKHVKQWWTVSMEHHLKVSHLFWKLKMLTDQNLAQDQAQSQAQNQLHFQKKPLS